MEGSARWQPDHLARFSADCALLDHFALGPLPSEGRLQLGRQRVPDGIVRPVLDVQGARGMWRSARASPLTSRASKENGSSWSDDSMLLLSEWTVRSEAVERRKSAGGGRRIETRVDGAQAWSRVSGDLKAQ